MFFEWFELRGQWHQLYESNLLFGFFNGLTSKSELVIAGEREHRCMKGERAKNGEEVVVFEVLHVQPPMGRWLGRFAVVCGLFHLLITPNTLTIVRILT